MITQTLDCTIPDKTEIRFVDENQTLLLSVDLVELRMVIEAAGSVNTNTGPQNLALFQKALKDAFKVELTTGQSWFIVTHSHNIFEELKKNCGLGQQQGISSQELEPTGSADSR